MPFDINIQKIAGDIPADSDEDCLCLSVCHQL
jgi:hypothetical protein